jgi:hypothetical protein
MGIMNHPSQDSVDWFKAVADNWAYIENNLLDKTLAAAKGDLIAATASASPARVPVGANDDTLIADSSQTTGLRWVGGINSTSAVTAVRARATTSTSTTSSTFADMDSMSLNVTVGATNKVLVIFSSTMKGGSNSGTVRIMRDSVDLKYGTGQGGTTWGVPMGMATVDQPGSGTFTYKVQWRVDTGTITQDLQPYSASGDRELIVVTLPG